MARYVVQSYIRNPLLLDGHKFDMRFYVLITSCNPLTVFVHKQGFTRISTERFSLSDFDNRGIHHTADRTQQTNFPNFVDPNAKHPNLGTLEDGFQSLQKRGVNIPNLKT
jgi:hypothetical protein